MTTKTVKTNCSSCWAEVVITHTLPAFFAVSVVKVRGEEVESGIDVDSDLIIWDCTCGHADSYDAAN